MTAALVAWSLLEPPGLGALAQPMAPWRSSWKMRVPSSEVGVGLIWLFLETLGSFCGCPLNTGPAIFGSGLEPPDLWKFPYDSMRYMWIDV